MKNKHDDQAGVEQLATDPLQFVALCWPQMRLTEKQQQVLLSVQDNFETFVHAANKMGKTLIAAIAAIWFFTSRTPARVIITSSNETQLASVLWSEIRHLIATSAWQLPVTVSHLSIKKLLSPNGTETEPSDYMLGQVAKATENFQGHHLPGDKPRVLAIFDEASGIADEFFEAAESWAHSKLVIGNPLCTTNFFYRLCKEGDKPDPAEEGKLYRKVIHIHGLDSPNVQLGQRWKKEGRPGKPPVLIEGLLTYGEYARREKMWDEVQRTTRLFGHFYLGDQAMLFPSAWLDAAMDHDRWAELQQQQRRVEAIGLDVAAGGNDNTCWTLVDHHGIIQQIVLDTPNTMEIVGRTIQLIQEHELFPHWVAIDADGIGKPIADRLAEQGYPVSLVGFGESADSKSSYKNRRAELYGGLRERLKPGREEGIFVLPPDAHQLRQELAVLPYSLDSEARLMLPPKGGSSARPGETTIRQMLGRSPDEADSLVLAVWVLDKFKPRQDVPEDEYDYDDQTPLSPEEIANLPDHLRAIFDVSDEWEREYKQRKMWGDDDW